MKKFLLIVIGIAISLSALAKSQEVTLIVSGEGSNKTEATNNALRMAIEQAFGTFVSANTAILNDEIVKNEIATISSGNIKSYKEIASSLTTNGESYVTLNVIVSVGKLISYAQSHGSSAEFAGNTFAANIKMRELNRKNELSALDAVATQIENLSNSLFDFNIEPDNNPKLDNSQAEQGYVFNVNLYLKSNSTSDLVRTMLLSTLGQISLNAQEVEEYNQNNYPYEILLFNNTEYAMRSDRDAISQFIIRIKDALNIAFFNVSISTKKPLDIEYSVDIKETERRPNTFISYATYEEFRKLNVCSKYSKFSESVVCPKEFAAFNMKSRTAHRGFSYGDELFIPCFSAFSEKGSIVAKLIVPVFIKTSDINYLTGFEVKRTPLIQENIVSSEPVLEPKSQVISQYFGAVKVGDTLSEFGGGIVFWISQDGTQAKLISKSEIAWKSWEESLRWCQNYGDGTWDMPTIDELTLIQKASAIINNTAASFDIQKLDMGNICYWSSTEFERRYAYRERMNDGLILHVGNDEMKSSTRNRTRAVKTISLMAE